MHSDHARQVVAGIPKHYHAALAAAYSRYMHFTGVWSGIGISKEQIASDRIAYAHLYKESDSGVPALSDERCAEFMAALTDLPFDWCLAWDEVEFTNEHGDLEDLLAHPEKLLPINL